MDWKKPEQREDGAVKIPHSWLFLHYYDALTALFRVENALRMFVYVVLKGGRKGRWAELTITSDDGGETTIAAVSKRRQAQDERFGYLGYRVGSPLMHLTSGELIRVMFADAYWPLFAEYFPATREIVRTKLEEIGNIRNALAHFRPIKADDVEVVKQNANQVLSRVEQVLTSIVSMHQIVPTNTTDAWYGRLKAIASPHFTVSFNQSDNEHWIQLRLTHTATHIGTPYSIETYRQWRVVTLLSSSVVRLAPEILNHVIYSAETLPAGYAEDQKEFPAFRKHVDLVFNRQTLADHHEAIAGDLDNTLRTVASETELMVEDSLARGQLVRVATVSAIKRNDYWSTDRAALRTRFREDDPVEFWTRLPSPGHMVTATERYPWMPIDVSAENDEDVPF